MRIENLASEFQLKLPRNYIAFLAAYPEEFTVTDEDLDLFEPIGDRYILNDLMRLEEFNLEVREDEREFANKPWPNRLFVIGHDGCGNYYAIDTEKPHGPVILWDTAADDFEPVADHIDDFANYVRELTGLA